MQIFPKEIMEELFKYHSDLPINDFKNAVDNFFIKENNFRSAADLVGIPSGKDKIEVADCSSILPKVPLFIGSLTAFRKSRLKVHFYENEQDITQINLTVVPNTAYPTLFVISPLIYIYILFEFPNDLRGALFYIVMIIIIISTPFLLITLSKITKNNLKNRFVEAFSLCNLG